MKLKQFVHVYENVPQDNVNVFRERLNQILHNLAVNIYRPHMWEGNGNVFILSLSGADPGFPVGGGGAPTLIGGGANL